MIKYIGKCLLITEKGEKILIIGDLHLGYEEALNKSGVYVTREMYKEMMGEMDEIFQKIVSSKSEGLGVIDKSNISKEEGDDINDSGKVNGRGVRGDNDK